MFAVISHILRYLNVLYIHWILGVFSPWTKCSECELTTYLHLVARLRMCGALPPAVYVRMTFLLIFMGHASWFTCGPVGCAESGWLPCSMGD
jgi:hypothetical protein